MPKTCSTLSWVSTKNLAKTGISMDVTALQRAILCLAVCHVQSGLERAISSGIEEQWRQDQRVKVTSIIQDRDLDPLGESFLAAAEDWQDDTRND